MPWVSLSLAYRPIRIGFLFQPGGVDTLARLAGINSLIWGGIRNALLPVGSGSDMPGELVRRFNVDVLSVVGESTPSIDALTARYPYLRSPSHQAEQLFVEDWQTKKQSPSVVDVIHIIERHWKEDFRHRPPEFRSRCVLVKWQADDPCGVVFALSFWHFNTGEALEDDFQFAFERGLRSQVISLTPQQELPTGLFELVCPDS